MKIKITAESGDDASASVTTIPISLVGTLPYVTTSRLSSHMATAPSPCCQTLTDTHCGYHPTM